MSASDGMGFENITLHGVMQWYEHTLKMTGGILTMPEGTKKQKALAILNYKLKCLNSAIDEVKADAAASSESFKVKQLEKMGNKVTELWKSIDRFGKDEKLFECLNGNESEKKTDQPPAQQGGKKRSKKKISKKRSKKMSW